MNFNKKIAKNENMVNKENQSGVTIPQVLIWQQRRGLGSTNRSGDTLAQEIEEITSLQFTGR